IVTLGGMLTFRGLTLVVLGGKTLAPFPDEFRSLSSAFWPDWFNGGDYNIFAIVVGFIASIIFVLYYIRIRKTDIKYYLKRSYYLIFISKFVLFIMIINIFTFFLKKYAGIPYILIILILLILGYTFVMKNTVLGRRVYAVGGNMKAAQLSGIKTKKVKF